MQITFLNLKNGNAKRLMYPGFCVKICENNLLLSKTFT